MKSLDFIRYTLCSYAAVAMLSACGAPEPSLNVPGAALPSAPAASAEAGRNLLYVSTLGDEPVYVYTYPGTKAIGILPGPIGPRGMCVDRSSDIFTPFIYIPGGIYEFAHGGGTPIAYLGYPYDGENGCSVDPTTGDLAVVGGPSFYPALVIYRYKAPHRWGFARSYALPSMSSSAFCGYDSHGDLFVDGKNSSGAFVLAELSKGSKTFAPISVSQDIKAAGQVQWDGKHLAIGDAGVSPSVIYQFDVTGSIATKSGSTKLAGSTMVEQFWIQRGSVIAPDPKRACGGSRAGCIAIYRYPAGGAAAKAIELPDAYGATVSIAPK